MNFHNVAGDKIESPKEYGWRPAVYGVLIENNRLLFIKPNWDNKYCLPGGSMNLGEIPTESLKREFIEETGYEVCVDPQPIYVDSHLFGKPDSNLYFQRINLYYKVEKISEKKEVNLDEESEKIIWEDLNNLNSEDFTFFQRNFLKTILKK